MSLYRNVSPLPHSLHPAGHTQPELCLIVKDLDRKDRDYEKTVRKNQQLIEKCKLTSTIAQVNNNFVLFLFCLLFDVYKYWLFCCN